MQDRMASAAAANHTEKLVPDEHDCLHAFSVVHNALDASVKVLPLRRKGCSSGLFVTFMQQRESVEEVARAAAHRHPPQTEEEVNRGCIGCLSPVPVDEALAAYALHAAFKDQRFKPITLPELKQCSCTVSYLSPMERAASWDDWESGTHGLWLTAHFAGKKFNSTFLPNVIEEEGWSKTETLIQLLKKSGFPGPADSSSFGNVVIERYESSRMKLTWADYIKEQEALLKLS